MKELDQARTEVTSAQFDLAKRSWQAFGSDNPLAILALLTEDTSALPYLAGALKRHLEEFPSIESGLSRSEYEALSAISEGHMTPVAAFLEVAKRQESIFLGDVVFYWYLERLSGNRNALVMWSNGGAVVAPTGETSREFVKRELKLTPLGREVLGARRDWQTLNPAPRWLGGVRIGPGGKGWRWDEGQRTLVRTGAPKRKPKAARPKRKKSTPKKKASRTTTRRKPSRAAKKRFPRRKK